MTSTLKRRILAASLLLGTLGVPVTISAVTHTPRACATEDSVSCVWHAHSQGDHRGHDVTNGPDAT